MEGPTTLRTALTDALGVRWPLMQAGMNKAAGASLCAAVTNAGGVGCIGGLGYTPRLLQQEIRMVKSQLQNPNGVFGVDLLLPRVGGGARATNYDYTGGRLEELIDVIVEEGVRLFVCAVGVPPASVVQRLHQHNILVMNMVGLPKHCSKALEAGVDIIGAQGTEAGGHTGDLATSVLVPACVDMCRGHCSPLTGRPVMVIAAGGIFDGRGVAMALALGADGVWVGTRFVCSEEAGASEAHQQEIMSAGFESTTRTLAFTGRPLRVKRMDSVKEWESTRRGEMESLLARGIIPYEFEQKKLQEEGRLDIRQRNLHERHMLMGQCAGAIRNVQPASVIVQSMMSEAVRTIRDMHAKL